MLLLQVVRNQQERGYLSPMVTFNSEFSVEAFSTLQPLTSTLGISQCSASDSRDIPNEISMAVILTCTHKVS